MERSTISRKIARIGFWGLIIYTALSTTVVWAIQLGFIPVPPRSVVVAGQSEKQAAAPALSETAFAEQFVREYLFWTQGKEESRAERLKPFWKPRMDVQGGIDFEKSKWNSYTRNVNVWEVKGRKDQSGIKDVTVFAETILTKADDPKEQKRVDRYLVVPIKKAGATYVVVDFPYFVAPPVATLPKEPEDQKEEKGTNVDEQVHGQVEQFMKSFWKVYTTGTPQEIAYFQKDNQPTPGLTGIMSFQEMKNLSVYQEGKEVRAECDVLLEDLASGAQVINHYRFYLVQDGERWYVVRMEQGEE
ncbi:conjugal transfer protein [Paenactinomyces guangxiensis]|uniref:Conjugal transfer protein n=1 Tax=Paenactinomyces guangxiensis TaxID=1490290 RepID=A0A7W1WPJ9_9BACL|nr:conjugal transfer protein [Paenactinomyces guangxiensis]MBA4493650.1 conjugal transfer protein [Paenactinomyces guangxiensis]MBH8590937.1 conjugal transfer protein [Paenactinomyces guangxiensis]